MKKFFKRLRARHWAWANVLFVTSILWPLFIIFATPSFLVGNVNPAVLVICMWIATFGGVVKIGGFFASQQVGRAGVLGVSVELVGLILSSLAPVSYLISYVTIMVFAAGDVNFGSALIFAYAVLAMYVYRAIIIVPRFRQEAHDPNKE